jgi:hypothetical protein
MSVARTESGAVPSRVRTVARIGLDASRPRQMFVARSVVRSWLTTARLGDIRREAARGTRTAGTPGLPNAANVPDAVHEAGI